MNIPENEEHNLGYFEGKQQKKKWLVLLLILIPCTLALRESHGFHYGVMARSPQKANANLLMRMKDDISEKRREFKEA